MSLKSFAILMLLELFKLGSSVADSCGWEVPGLELRGSERSTDSKEPWLFLPGFGVLAPPLSFEGRGMETLQRKEKKKERKK